MFKNYDDVKHKLDRSKVFCMCPFRRITRHPFGGVTCCAHAFDLDVPSGKYDNLNDVFHDKAFDDFREKIFRGEPQTCCQQCYMNERIGVMSVRMAANIQNGILNEDMIPDEMPEPKLTEVELYPSKKCNFQCVICSPKNSTVWEKDIQVNKNFFDHYIDDRFKDEMLVNYNDTPSTLEGINLKDLNILFLSGGEPSLLREFNEDFFEKYGTQFNYDKLCFQLVLNNSIFPHHSFMEFLKKVKHFLLYLSIDGVGEVGEFCRKGLKMRVFDRNLRKWIEFFEQNEWEKNVTETEYLNSWTGQIDPSYKSKPPFLSGLRFFIVMSTYNVFNLGHTLEYLNQYGLRDRGDFRNCYLPEYLSIQYLPDDIKKFIETETYFYDDDHKEFVVDVLHSDSYDKEFCSKFINYTNYLASAWDVIPKECLIIYNLLKKNHGF